ncbi:MAG: hypothetical protein AAF957_10475 [Planctomycetota bacterium]
MRYRAPLAAFAAALALAAAFGQEKESPVAREKRLHAQQLRALRERAAEDAEAYAKALEDSARRLETIAADAAETAKAARREADAARERADAARRRANQAAGDVRRLGGPGAAGGARTPRQALGGTSNPRKAAEEVSGEGAGSAGAAAGDAAAGGAADAPRSAPKQASGSGVRRPRMTAFGGATETDKHAAAGRSPDQNKATYIEAKRAQRSRGRERMEKTFTFDPGAAPDMGDLDIYGMWQWAVNVARGEIGRGGRKNGDINIARCSFQPKAGTQAVREMKWGMRRYNLGDVTVVDCDFTDIPKEHGVYDNLAGHGLYQGNTFYKLGGQALQIAYRDKPYNQYPPDNMPFTGKPTIVVDDCHAVDCGLDPSRSAFTWTFFDPGTKQFPGTVILRNCTSVHAWPFIREGNGQRVPANHPQAMRSPGGLVLTQYQHRSGNAKQPTTETLVVDNCLFDHTLSGMPVAAVRGVGTILIEDSCFLARNHRNPHFDVDDEPGRPSGKVIVENCVSPEGRRVWLRIRKKRVMPLHCPGKRFEIDVKTLKVTEVEVQDDPITRLISPLEGRTARGGIGRASSGGRVDLGTVDPRYAPAPAGSGSGQ